jgi:hypothetical protein
VETTPLNKNGEQTLPHYNTRLQQGLRQCNRVQTLPTSKNMMITPEMDGILTSPLANAVIDPDTGIA